MNLAKALDAHLRECYADDKAGAVLLVAKDGEVLYEGHTGKTVIGQDKSINGNTNFRLASVSKQFTAMGVQLLQQEGKLQYSDPLYHFFPKLEALCPEVTLQHLITHTSGLPDYEAFVCDSRQEQVTDKEVLEITSVQRSLLFRPGAQFRYSNTGYVLLALVIEQVTGMAYADFLGEYIFAPLGMHHTKLYEEGKPISNRAMGYAAHKSDGFILSDQSVCSATKGDGCIYTSVRDYLKWHLALALPGKYNLQASLQSISAPVCNHAHLRYGMGWFFDTSSKGSPEMFHTGNTCGFSNLVVRIPERQVLVACFTNVADNPYLTGALVDILQQFPETRLESGLIKKLPELTR